MNTSWLVRCGAGAMLAVALTNVGCVSSARRALVYDVAKPQFVAMQPPSVVTQGAPIEIGVSIEPTPLATAPPVVVVAAPSAPPPAPPPIVTSSAREVLTSLGFEVMNEMRRTVPIAGVPAEVEVTVARRREVIEMSYVFTTADDATAASYASALGTMGGRGLAVTRGRIVYWVATTPDNAAWNQAILARLAG